MLTPHNQSSTIPTTFNPPIPPDTQTSPNTLTLLTPLNQTSTSNSYNPKITPKKAIEIIFNCKDAHDIKDILSSDISNKTFITHNNYNHTHFFCKWFQFKAKNIKYEFEKTFDQTKNKFVAKLAKKKN